MNYQELEAALEKARNFYEIDSQVLIALQTTQPLDEDNILRIRAYVLLSFAAIQETLEDLSVKILEDSIELYKQKQILNAVIISLIRESIISLNTFKENTNENRLIRDNLEIIIQSISQRKGVSRKIKNLFNADPDGLNEKFVLVLENELKKHIKLIDKNNGFSVDILREKLFYFSEDVKELLNDRILIIDLDRVRYKRGDFAHKASIQITRERDYRNLIESLKKCIDFVKEVENISNTVK